MTNHVCEIGRFSLDLRNARLLAGGRHVPLGSRAADVLVALARAQGEIVSREELIAQAWRGLAVDDNNLPVQIGVLRKLLGTAPDGSSWIQTVSGRGYRLHAPPAEDEQPPLPPLEPQSLSFCRTSDSVNLAVGVRGEGPPLVRVGLWMTHLEYEARTRVWAPLLSHLSRASTLVCYDARGCGLSDRDVTHFSLDRSVSDLLAVLDHLAIERATILGMSQGAPVAVRFAAQHPDRVDKLILHGGFARGWGVEAEPAVVAHAEALITLIRQGWGRDNPSFRQIFTSLGFPDGSRDDFDAYNELQRHSVEPETAARIVESLREIDVRPDLARIVAPTLVTHSLRDAWVPVEAGRGLAAGIRGARFMGLDSSNHLPIPPDAEFHRLAAAIADAATASVRPADILPA